MLARIDNRKTQDAGLKRRWNPNDVFDFEWNYVPYHRYGPILKDYHQQLTQLLKDGIKRVYPTGTANMEAFIIRQCVNDSTKRAEYTQEYRYTGTMQGLPYLSRLLSVCLLSPVLELDEKDVWRFRYKTKEDKHSYYILLDNWWTRLGEAFGQFVELDGPVRAYFTRQRSTFTCIADIEVELLSILAFLQYELGLRFPIEEYRPLLLPFAVLMSPDLLKYISTLHH